MQSHDIGWYMPLGEALLNAGAMHHVLQLSYLLALAAS